MRQLLLLGCAVAIGCSSSNGSGTDGAVSADMATAAAATITGHVVGTGSTGPLAGATVSVVGTQTSATTAADGSFSLSAPAGAAIFVVAKLTGYIDTEVGYVVPAGGGMIPNIVATAMTTVQQTDQALSPPATYDATKGTVFVDANDIGHAGGYMVAISAAHDNPIVTSTPPAYGSTTQPNVSVIAFPNVTVGMTTATVTPPTGKTCAPNQAITNWPVVANTITWITFDCH